MTQPNQPLHSRRSALKTIAAIATVQIVPSHLLWGARTPSNTLTKAIIGCGGISGTHFGKPGRLLACCDVDRKRLDKKMAGQKKNPEVKGYSDFREIMERKDIDIVHIATPPHWHALMAIAAAKSGKDIWCEKPMSRTIGEGIAMIKAVEDHKRIFRLNTWFRFRGKYYWFKRPAADVWKVAHHGLLGDGPLTFKIGTGGLKLGKWAGRTDLVEQPVPEHLDYNMWLGPAPLKPYHADRVHAKFRGYWDYDGGGLGDMGQHYLDPAQFILGKDNESPVHIEVDTDQQDLDAVLPWRRLEMVYADGTKIIIDAEHKDNDPILIGSKGHLGPNFESNIPDIEKKIAELAGPPEVITDFHQAVRERKQFALNEHNGFRSCNLINLAKIAMRTGRKLEFDSEKLRFINDADADTYIDQPMRGPWKL